MPIYLPTFIFYVLAIELTRCKCQNEKEIMNYKSLSHILVPIYLSTFIFYVFAIELTKCKSQNEKEIMSYNFLSRILVFD